MKKLIVICTVLLALPMIAVSQIKYPLQPTAYPDIHHYLLNETDYGKDFYMNISAVKDNDILTATYMPYLSGTKKKVKEIMKDMAIVTAGTDKWVNKSLISKGKGFAMMHLYGRFSVIFTETPSNKSIREYISLDDRPSSTLDMNPRLNTGIGVGGGSGGFGMGVSTGLSLNLNREKTYTVVIFDHKTANFRALTYAYLQELQEEFPDFIIPADISINNSNNILKYFEILNGTL